MKLATRNLLIVGIGVLIALVVLVGFFFFVPPPPPPRAAPPPSLAAPPRPPRPFPEASRALSPPFSLPKQSAGTPPSSVELVDEILRNLSWGNIAFNVPTEMRYAEPHFVELLLSPSLSAADLQAQLEQKAGAESAHIQVSNRMEAKLTGLGFKIEALQPDLQAVTSQQTTRWKWEVTPTEHGSRTVNLALSALVDVDRTRHTFRRPDIWSGDSSLHHYPAAGLWVYTEELAVVVGCHCCADRGIFMEAQEESRQWVLTPRARLRRSPNSNRHHKQRHPTPGGYTPACERPVPL